MLKILHVITDLAVSIRCYVNTLYIMFIGCIVMCAVVCVCCKEGFDVAFLKVALLERLKDDVPDVVLSALSALQVGRRLKPDRHQ